MSRVLTSLEERVRVFQRDRGGALFFVWMALVYLVGTWLAATPRNPLDLSVDFVSGLKLVGIVAFGWLGVGLTHGALFMYVRCLARKLDRRLNREKDDG
jgi:hypothetical protein